MKKRTILFTAAAATAIAVGCRRHQKNRALKYSREDEYPEGTASEDVTAGCLILEGGSLRGFYTAGVLDSLMEAGINLQTVIGVSAGTMMGCGYLSGQIGRSVRFNTRNRFNLHYIGVGAELENKSPFNFSFAFDDQNFDTPLDRARLYRKDRRFIAVATDCETGQPVYFDRDECSDFFKAIRASSSLPFFSAMVSVDGHQCLDGGISDPLPIDWALEQGFSKIIVVRTRTRDFRKPGTSESLLKNYRYKKYPRLLGALASQSQRYNETCEKLNRLEEEGRVLVIAPDKNVTVSRLEKDLEKLGDFYFEGYEGTNRRIEEIQEYLDLTVACCEDSP